MERNKGRLFPVGEDVALLAERVVPKLYEYYDNKLEQFKDDPGEYGYTFMNGKLYEVEWDIEGGDDCGFADVVEEDGVISFHTLHYNGGAHWTEVVEAELEEK